MKKLYLHNLAHLIARREGCSLGLVWAGDVSRKALEVKVSSYVKDRCPLRRIVAVVIGNVEEKGSDIEDKAEIVKFMAEKFQVEVDPSSVSRVGRNKGNKCRLALIALHSFVDKVKVLKNAKILKGSRVFVSPDFNKEERVLRKQVRRSDSGRSLRL